MVCFFAEVFYNLEQLILSIFEFDWIHNLFKDWGGLLPDILFWKYAEYVDDELQDGKQLMVFR